MDNFSDVIEFFKKLEYSVKDILDLENSPIFQDRVKLYSKIAQDDCIKYVYSKANTGPINVTYLFDEPCIKLYRGVFGEYADRVFCALKDNKEGITLEVPVASLSVWSLDPIEASNIDNPVLLLQSWVPISKIVYFDKYVIINAKSVKINYEDCNSYKGETLAKSEESSSDEFIYAIMGFPKAFTRILNAAMFLAGKEELDEGSIREAFLIAHEDEHKAALIACGLKATEENLEALEGILALGYLGKSESDEGLSTLQNKHKVSSDFVDSKHVLKEIEEAFADNFVIPIQLKGKHTKGILLAREPQKGKVWLLKPGYGKSPIIGETDIPSFKREAAAYQIAKVTGLARFIPPAYAVNVDGIDYAAITLLNWDYKTLDYLKRKEPARLVEVMQPYVANGDIFRWAAFDYIIGSGADRHGGNMMVSPQNEVFLIDFGTSFLDNRWETTNKHGFVPFYLRFNIQGFYDLDKEKQLKYMPTISNKIDDEVVNWFVQAYENLVDYGKDIMFEYGIDPAPILNRGARLRQLIEDSKISNTLNALWIGLLQ
jgi:hypothetical protein